jgi:hypothetical protein
MIKLVAMRWEGHVPRVIEKRIAYEVLVEKCEVKAPLLLQFVDPLVSNDLEINNVTTFAPMQ